MLLDVLGKRLQNVEPSSVREVIYKLNESGKIDEIIFVIEIPAGTRTPLKLENAEILTEIANGKARTHRISVRIKL